LIETRPAIFGTIISKREEGPITDVGRATDMPSRVLFDSYLKKNPVFKEWYERILGDLPYELQARRRRLMGNRFRKDVAKLRKKGHSWSAIGRTLGVHPGTARKAWQEFNA
jgi:hypothetical protein